MTADRAEPAMTAWVRGALVGIALSLTAVFTVAVCLNPYQPDGTALRMETHRQMNLPECGFKKFTGLPCPACGMTTSFALLVRGDVWNSLRANAVGTMLAVIGLATIPWSLASVVCGRPLFIRSMERTMLLIVGGFVTLMMLRWVIVLLLSWRSGTY